MGVYPAPGSGIMGIKKWDGEYVPKFFEPERIDEIVEVSTGEAVQMVQKMAR